MAHKPNKRLAPNYFRSYQVKHQMGPQFTLYIFHFLVTYNRRTKRHDPSLQAELDLRIIMEGAIENHPNSLT